MTKKIDPTNLGKRIREARKSIGITQKALAEKLGVGNNYVSMLERGAKIPSMETFIELINVLDIPADDLLLDYTRFGPAKRNAALQEEIGKLDMQQQQMLLNIMESVTDLFTRN